MEECRKSPRPQDAVSVVPHGGMQHRRRRKQPNPRRWDDVVWLGCDLAKTSPRQKAENQSTSRLPQTEVLPYRKQVEVLPKQEAPIAVQTVAVDPVFKVLDAFKVSSRAEDLIQRYVRQVSRVCMDTVQMGLRVKPGYPALTRAEKRIISSARGAIVNHENFKRFPEAGLHNFLDNKPLLHSPQRPFISLVTRAIQPHKLCIPEVLEHRTLPLSSEQVRRYAYEKRAVQMHEAALSLLMTFDSRPPGMRGLPLDP